MSIYLQFGQSELFPLTRACVVCGTEFEFAKRRGRPEAFCSETCRLKQHREQKNAWARNRARSEGVEISTPSAAER